MLLKTFIVFFLSTGSATKPDAFCIHTDNSTVFAETHGLNDFDYVFKFKDYQLDFFKPCGHACDFNSSVECAKGFYLDTTGSRLENKYLTCTRCRLWSRVCLKHYLDEFGEKSKAYKEVMHWCNQECNTYVAEHFYNFAEDIKVKKSDSVQTQCQILEIQHECNMGMGFYLNVRYPYWGPLYNTDKHFFQNTLDYEITNFYNGGHPSIENLAYFDDDNCSFLQRPYPRCELELLLLGSPNLKPRGNQHANNANPRLRKVNYNLPVSDEPNSNRVKLFYGFPGNAVPLPQNFEELVNFKSFWQRHLPLQLVLLSKFHYQSGHKYFDVYNIEVPFTVARLEEQSENLQADIVRGLMQEKRSNVVYANISFETWRDNRYLVTKEIVKYIAKFIKTLYELRLLLCLKDVHIIGFYYTCHIAGHIGSEIQDTENDILIGRITGLSPWGYSDLEIDEDAFLDHPLNKSDAAFVEVFDFSLPFQIKVFDYRNKYLACMTTEYHKEMAHRLIYTNFFNKTIYDRYVSRGGKKDSRYGNRWGFKNHQSPYKRSYLHWSLIPHKELLWDWETFRLSQLATFELYGRSVYGYTKDFLSRQCNPKTNDNGEWQVRRNCTGQDFYFGYDRPTSPHGIFFFETDISSQAKFDWPISRDTQNLFSPANSNSDDTFIR